MKRFTINGQSVLLFEERLWVPLEPELTIHSDEPVVKIKHQKTQGVKRGPKPGGHRMRSKLIEQEDLQRIKEMINAGYPAQEIGEKFGATAQYVYNIKMRMKKDGELTTT